MRSQTPWKSRRTTAAVLDDLHVLICEPAQQYHAQAGRYLSSHLLADFRKSPLLYHRKTQGRIKSEETPAYLVGRAAHTLILEGREPFQAEFAVGGPVNPKTGNVYGANTKAFAEWAKAQRKPVLTDTQHELVVRLAEGVRSHTFARELLSDGLPERVVRTKYGEVDCQIRMDWFDPVRGIVDLKTCDDLTWFEADARRYGYVHQLAFYRAVLTHAIGSRMPVHLIAVEKKEPFRCGVWEVSREVLGIAERDNERAIARLRECAASGVWPTGYEEKRLLDSVA
ncbi:PD-(D/E)XK nuclease-like domain-containing protein [Maioricimonas sp. JC845]|uniref:PD-(D/E)XK nuclease-like domain-containing protein n=1 Tax=Maioricimonas sp. JC845 TaxID=3232138 RepID=UPI003459591F